MYIQRTDAINIGFCFRAIICTLKSETNPNIIFIIIFLIAFSVDFESLRGLYRTSICLQFTLIKLPLQCSLAMNLIALQIHHRTICYLHLLQQALPGISHLQAGILATSRAFCASARKEFNYAPSTPRRSGGANSAFTERVGV